MEKKEEIISNKIKCKKCGDIMESKSTNDYKRGNRKWLAGA